MDVWMVGSRGLSYGEWVRAGGVRGTLFACADRQESGVLVFALGIAATGPSTVVTSTIVVTSSTEQRHAIVCVSVDGRGGCGPPWVGRDGCVVGLRARMCGLAASLISVVACDHRERVVHGSAAEVPEERRTRKRRERDDRDNEEANPVVHRFLLNGVAGAPEGHVPLRQCLLGT